MAILDADLRRVSAGGGTGAVLVPFRRPPPDRSLSVAVSSRTSTAVDMLVEEIAQSQPLPPIAAQVLQIAENTRFSAHELAQAISSDPASTCLILRLANSPYYSLPCRISTVRDAVVLLGFQQVSALVIGAAMMRAFATPNAGTSTAAQVVPEVEWWQFWRHAIAVGLMSEVLARADRVHCDVALTAGFLHSIGRIALALARPKDFAEARSRAVATGVPLQTVERDLLGATDTEIGAALLSRWGFCPDVVAAVWQQAEGDEAFDDASLGSLIARARVMVEASGLTDGIERAPCAPTLAAPDCGSLPDGSAVVLRRDPLIDGIAALAPMMPRVEAFLDHAGMT